MRHHLFRDNDPRGELWSWKTSILFASSSNIKGSQVVSHPRAIQYHCIFSSKIRGRHYPNSDHATEQTQGLVPVLSHG